MSRLAAAVLLTVIFSGCIAGSDYRRPIVETPQSWRFEEKEAKNIANTAWWEQFNDPALNNLIGIALHENKDLRIAGARVEEFIGKYAVARAALFPQVNGNANAERERTTQRGQEALPAGTPNPVGQYQVSLSASWEIDLWGKLRREREAARAELLGTEEGRRAVIMSLVASVAGAYVNLRNLDAQLEIARRTANIRKDSYEIFALRFKGGLISELELSQAKSEYEQALAIIPALEKAIARQENALSILIGHNPAPVQRGKSLTELAILAIPSGLPADLLEQRPDIRQAEQKLIAANARIGVARAAYFPDISLTGMFGWESIKLSSLFTGPARTWNWTVPLTAPIFMGGAIAGYVKETEAVREEALLEYQQTIQNGFREVEDALIDQKRSREQIDALARQVEALRTSSRMARLRYDNGYTSYIEVLDAERSLFNAELDYTQTRGLLFQAMIDLYKALGGGWITAADNLSRK